MSPNHRGPIYAQINAALQRVMTPDEKIRLDKVLDSMGVPTRWK